MNYRSFEEASVAEVGLGTWQLVLRWILDHPQVTTVIPGATKKANVTSNTGASSLQPLEAETHRSLRALYDEEIRPHIRGRY